MKRELITMAKEKMQALIAHFQSKSGTFSLFSYQQFSSLSS